MRDGLRAFGVGGALILAAAFPAAAAEVFQSVPTSAPAVVHGTPVSYMVDDGSVDNNIGLNNTATMTATQFMWFNRFDVLGSDLPLQVDQVQVFWDPTPAGAAEVGDAISLEIFSDTDANPANGATHEYTENDTVAQVGTMFDVYNLTTPPVLAAAVNLLVGVVDRWVTSGVTGTTFSAAIDQTNPDNGRSFVASSASGTPPTPPVIPSDGLFGTIDGFGLPGDWMIRAGASVVPVELQSFSVD
jgi:hypothetical protein